MNWTTRKPTQSGYYWYREPELETTIVRVLIFDDPMSRMCGSPVKRSITCSVTVTAPGMVLWNNPDEVHAGESYEIGRPTLA
jgi:hypothetical protein